MDGFHDTSKIKVHRSGNVLIMPFFNELPSFKQKKNEADLQNP